MVLLIMTMHILQTCNYIPTIDFHKHPHLLQHGWMIYIARVVKADCLIAIIMDMEMKTALIMRMLL